MALQSIMFRACSIVGYNSKSPICSRVLLPLHQQTAGLAAKSLESQLGLPEKPKRPLTPFLRYVQSMRPKLKSENPELKNSDIMKILSIDWKECDPLIKKQLTEESKKSSLEYVAALEKYRHSLSKEDAEAIHEAKTKAKEVKQVKDLKKKLKKLNKPKRPVNGFLLFVESERAKGTFANLKNIEVVKVASELWKKAPESNRAEFREKSQAAIRQYKIDLEAWEERMVAEGHVDVLYDAKSKPKKKK